MPVAIVFRPIIKPIPYDYTAMTNARIISQKAAAQNLEIKMDRYLQITARNARDK